MFEDTLLDNFTNSTNSTHEEHEAHGHSFLPVVILFIFGSCALGAIARMIVHKVSLLPYTVILLIFGLILGGISKAEPEVRQYTNSMTNMNPHIIFYVFLPVLVFESAYAMEAHTFLKSFWQIVTLAVFGLLFSIATTAYICLTLFGEYEWSWPVGLMFGSVISATDPVAVVALLKELGASEQLAILLEGESLLNDGTAIVAFEVFEDIAAGEHLTALDIFLLFILKAIGGPIFGYIMAQIAVYWLSNVFNDALTEITVTLAFTYSTFFIGEGLFHSSGVLATVVLGVTLSSNRASISPEVEVFLHRFWEMLAYLANTLIFILVGTVITEQVMESLTGRDLMLNLALYCALTVVRFLMVVVFSPIVTRIGYGLQHKEATVIVWGGLRGAVGLALALIVRQNREIDETNRIQTQVLIQTAGIVLLTLVVNATTIKPLLWVLGMSEISVSKRIAMASAVRNVKGTVSTTIKLFVTDRFLADADWDVVSKYTKIDDPYKTKEEEALLETLQNQQKPQTATECDVSNEGDETEEFKEMREEARLRLLKTEKISYWRQYEHGLLNREALEKLIVLVEHAADNPPELTDTHEIERTWKIKSYYSVLRDRLYRWHHSKEEEANIDPPSYRFGKLMHYVCSSIAFDIIMYFIIFVNSAIIIWLIVEDTRLCKDEMDRKYGVIPDVLNWSFTALYTIEFLMKIVAFRMKYFSSKWNIFDFVVLLASFVDIIVDFTYFRRMNSNTCSGAPAGFSPTILRIGKSLRFLRLLRTLRLMKGVIPTVMSFLDNKVNGKLRLAYDVAHSYVEAEDEVLHFLNHLVEDKTISNEFKSELSERRLEVIKGLGVIQRMYPGVAVSIKTQLAARKILNNVRNKIQEMKNDGILDESEAEKVTAGVEFRMKQLMQIPATINPPSPEKIVENLSWVRGDEKLIEFFNQNASLASMMHNDHIPAESTATSGLYIIISGMVKIEKQVAVTTDDNLSEAERDNRSSLSGVSEDKKYDFLSTGAVLGEAALLTGKPGHVNFICETSVQLYHLPYEAAIEAIEKFKDEPSLEYRLWKVCSARLAARLLHNQAKYMQWTKENMKLFLQKAKVIMQAHPSAEERGTDYKNPEIVLNRDNIIDAVLVWGTARDEHTGWVFDGPAYIPEYVTLMTLYPGKTDKHVFLLTVRHNDPHLIPDSETGSCSTLQYANLCLKHASKTRATLKQDIKDMKSGRSIGSLRRRSQMSGSGKISLDSKYHMKTGLDPLDTL